MRSFALLSILALFGCAIQQPIKSSSLDSLTYNPNSKVAADKIQEDLSRSDEVKQRYVKTEVQEDGSGNKTTKKVPATRGTGIVIKAFPTTEAYFHALANEKATEQGILNNWPPEQVKAEGDKDAQTIIKKNEKHQCFQMVVSSSELTPNINLEEKTRPQLDPKNWKVEVVQGNIRKELSIALGNAVVNSTIHTYTSQYGSSSNRENTFTADWFGCASAQLILDDTFSLAITPKFGQYLEPFQLVWQAPKKNQPPPVAK